MLILTIILPFFGTALGAAAVFLLRSRQNRFAGCLAGFAAGVMSAAAVWSLLLPAIECAAPPRVLAPSIGFTAGIAFLIGCERLYAGCKWKKSTNDKDSALKANGMLLFAVTLHNIPEGMAVGISLATALMHGESTALATAIALSLGIAIQNVPEGAIISMPLRAYGMKKCKAFLLGALSGAVEPIAAAISLMLSTALAKRMPLFLGFAAGAMIYVCANELIPDSKSKTGMPTGAIGFCAGFLLMMILDVAL